MKTARITRMGAARLLLALCLSAAATSQALDFTYAVANGAATITKHNGTNAKVAIPNAIEGVPVTVIGPGAFYRSGLAEVVMGNSVTSLCQGAFALCAGLTNVTMSGSLISIGSEAFYHCTRLPRLTIPDSVTSIGGAAFVNCVNLTELTVGEGNPVYSSVNGVLFDKRQTLLIQCPGGKSGDYPVPGSVIRVGDNAFDTCLHLTGVALSNGVTCIGNKAFSYCNRLQSVRLPGSLTNIGDSAFLHCKNLTEIEVDERNPVFSGADGVLFNKDRTTLIAVPQGKTGDYGVPAGVTDIGDKAFLYCGGLASVKIPDGVTRIGVHAFAECKGLTNVVIGVGVTGIGDSAFRSCVGLATVEIPVKVENIGNNAFWYCKGMTGIRFCGDAPSLGKDVFKGADNVTVYHLPGTRGWDAVFGGRPTKEWDRKP